MNIESVMRPVKNAMGPMLLAGTAGGLTYTADHLVVNDRQARILHEAGHKEVVSMEPFQNLMLGGMWAGIAATGIGLAGTALLVRTKGDPHMLAPLLNYGVTVAAGIGTSKLISELTINQAAKRD